MDIKKQADEFYIRLQIQMNQMNIDKLAGHLKTHELATLYIIDCCRNENGGIYVSKIAEFLHIPMSAVSRILKRLEDELHYIERKPDPKDRRNTLVSLSTDGKAYFDKTMNFAKEFAQRIFNCLTPEEQHTFFELSDKLKKASEIEFTKLYQQTHPKENDND